MRRVNDVAPTSAAALKAMVKEAKQKYEKTLANNQGEVQDIDDSEILLLSNMWIAQNELLFNTFLAQLNETSEQLSFWNERLMNPWAFVLENKPLTWVRIMHEPYKHVEKLEAIVRKLKKMQKNTARQLGRIKRMTIQLAHKSLGEMRMHIRYYLISNQMFLSQAFEDANLQLDNQLDEPEAEASTLVTATPDIKSTLKLDVSISTLYSLLENCCDDIQAYQAAATEEFSKLRPPGHMNRNWLAYSVLAIGGAYLGRFLYKHSSLNGSNDLNHWVDQAKAGISEFFKVHLYLPIESIFAQVFKNEYEAIFDQNELIEAKVSMRRMLLSLSKELYPHVAEEELAKAAETFDMRIVETKFEEEIKRPLKNIMFGELVRIVLINTQRIKLDMLQTMQELDGILKHQQLNFYIMATVPIVMLFGSTLWYLRRALFSNEANIALARAQIVQHLREAERILNRASGTTSESSQHTSHFTVLKSYDLGFLLLGLSKIEQQLNNVPSHMNEGLKGEDVVSSFRNDLAELESDTYTLKQKLRTIARMWRTYKFLNGNK